MLIKMWFHAHTFVVLLILFGEFQAAKALTDCSSITVDPSEQGQFSTIQSALDSIPSGNNKWACINIKPGTYREKVNIPLDKPYIMLRGEGSNNTFIEWNDSDKLDESFTFGVFADNIKVRGITFTNTYNTPYDSKTPRKPAVAVFVMGDKCSFYQCRFVGVQDTLWDGQGKHYFEECHIVGAVDFILGMGQSIYQNCVITFVGDALDKGIKGFITAQGRTNLNDANGFVFKNCNIIGTGSAYLGRPWREYARVLFYETSMSNIVMPSGWDSWHSVGHEDQLTFAEYECTGPGSKTSKRVSWEKKLNSPEVKRLTDISYIDSEGWINNQPI